MYKTFYVNNFCSFKESFEISFESTKLKTEKNPNGSLFALGIKGANGSGKTAILKSMEFLGSFIKNSVTKDKNSGTLVNSYFHNTNDTEFYVEFVSEDTEYIYELKLNSNFVNYESLSIKVKGKALKNIFKRSSSHKFSFLDAEYKEFSGISLRKNASVVSHLSLFEFKAEMKELNDFLKLNHNFLSNVSYVDGMIETDTEIVDDSWISKVYHENKTTFDFMKNILVESDIGIDNIEIAETIKKDGATEYYPVFIYEIGDMKERMMLYEQSSGTKTLYRQLFLYAWTLSSGGVLILDEFDKHLHSLMLPRILELFLDPEKNTKGAQFIFTAHNTEVMDYLGKYRTLLTQKDEKESFAYKLDEISGSLVRNDRKISPLYLSGKVGGVPRI
ncbi:ATP-binding protein [Shewanella olleyana]|uniref:AAA family ATPase n=1 Tax=Shewanella olleyana TaxID=135626 RepID=UPI0020100019|nr:ATP-binding protein [Shewanella olleyana]MCL1065856.1 ATP-binding protein [Shewanella olleyana]